MPHRHKAGMPHRHKAGMTENLVFVIPGLSRNPKKAKARMDSGIKPE
jgi:hypothetical protein